MEPPIKPDQSDCCNSGCTPCILDIYEEQLRKYEQALKGTPKQVNNCLSPTSFTVFKLSNIEKHSRDCYLYTFEYVEPHKPLKTLKDVEVYILYEPGQHFLVKGDFHGETFQKAYTPLFIESLPKNQFTVLVKLYDNGRMSSFFRRLTIGSNTLWRGPYGDFRINYEHKNILFIAQGTGIAPFYTIICDIVNNFDCYTFLRLIFCCNSENVLLREELYRLMQFWNFRYELFVSGGSKEDFQAKYNEVVHFSRLSTRNIEIFLKEAKGGIKILVCGAECFCENIRNILVQCGVANDDIVVF